MRRSSIPFVILGFLLGTFSAHSFADKMQALGLSPDGQPLIEETSPAPPPPADVLHFPAQEGDVELQRAQLLDVLDAPVTTRIETMVQLLMAGPTEQEKAESGAQPVFPEGTELRNIAINEHNVAELSFDFPESFLDRLRADEPAFKPVADAIFESGYHLPVMGYKLLALDRTDGIYKSIDSFVPRPAFLDDPGTPDTASPVDPELSTETKGLGQFSRPTSGQPAGSLTNHTVYLNAGHGWSWRSSSDSWGLQRGFVHNNIEDFSNADIVHQYLHAYLYNAGADVFSVRETDPNPNMVVVDNDDGAPHYVETGDGWTNSSLAGYANGHAPYQRADNPFSFGTNRLVTCSTGSPTATATWTPTIPASGYYNVYVSHAAFTNRAPQTHYRIYHAGGYTDQYIDQRRHRFTWILLGRYYFEQGFNPDTGKVVLHNTSTSESHYVSADAVRFGGGTGLVTRGNAGTSGFRRYDEEAVYHLSYSGAPTSVHQRSSEDMNSGWSGRPRFGGWLEGQGTTYGAPSQHSVFVSYHTNATAQGTARGAISYLWSGMENTYHDRYRRTVHEWAMKNLRQDYGRNDVENSNPFRSGQSWGEANPGNTGGIPIFLGEWLFHDNAQDMALYHDPKYRRMLARGIYQGIVKFFQSEYGSPGTLLPEPPRNLRVSVAGSTSVQLQWQAPPTHAQGIYGDPPTGYRVYTSIHGRGFPPGDSVTGTQTTINGLTPGETYYFYVTATNAGGESFPTAVLAARLPETSSAPSVLVVNGFDKVDVATRVQVPWSGSTLYRQFVNEMNRFDYIIEHARAIDAWGKPIAVDSTEHTAVEAQLISLSSYDAVIWIGGLQAEVSTADPTDDTALKPNSRSALTSYMNAGGRLFMSGAEIGWDLNRLNQSAMKNSTLRFEFVQDGSNLSEASGANGSIFNGLDNIRFGQGSGAAYTVHWPDIISPANGSIAALEYGSGGGITLIDGFETLGQWRHPGFSGQTNADPSSTFGIANSPVRTGLGSGDLYYVWGSGNFIRLYNQGLPQFPAASDFSIWVYGDNSGHQVRICLRDSDSDLFVNDWTVINFNGWREIRWEDVANNPQNVWVQSGDGQVNGPNMRFDSIHLEKVTGQNSGHLYFDDATYAPTGGGNGGSSGPVAAIQYSDGTRKQVQMGFPFETISDETSRNEVMARILDFFDFADESAVPQEGWILH